MSAYTGNKMTEREFAMAIVELCEKANSSGLSTATIHGNLKSQLVMIEAQWSNQTIVKILRLAEEQKKATQQ